MASKWETKGSTGNSLLRVTGRLISVRKKAIGRQEKVLPRFVVCSTGLDVLLPATRHFSHAANQIAIPGVALIVLGGLVYAASSESIHNWDLDGLYQVKRKLVQGKNCMERSLKRWLNQHEDYAYLHSLMPELREQEADTSGHENVGTESARHSKAKTQYLTDEASLQRILNFKIDAVALTPEELEHGRKAVQAVYPNLALHFIDAFLKLDNGKAEEVLDLLRRLQEHSGHTAKQLQIGTSKSSTQFKAKQKYQKLENKPSSIENEDLRRPEPCPQHILCQAREQSAQSLASVPDYNQKKRLESEAQSLRDKWWLSLKLANTYRLAAAQKAYDGDEHLARQIWRKAHKYDKAANKLHFQLNKKAFQASNLYTKRMLPIDLHGMTVEGALDTLKENIRASLSLTFKYDLQVVTGCGKHSVDGIPRIQPAVVKYLIKHNYPFQQCPERPGCYNVILSSI